ncbi:adenylate kinase 7-like [Salarias fasciatus]|uniref:adenylate kinase 7-like n=1 Tax=Salarias fasciatus TaxID=181472 RepID=UPI001176D813|nr:adenylate kinase 7-like [Salarias fasciatus]
MEDKKRIKRIFVNDVHRYSSKNIAEFLSGCSSGESPEDRGRQAAFEVVGTTSSSSCREDGSKSLFEQYESPTRNELFQHLLECDVVVYNISETTAQQQIEEATWALTALHAEMENFKYGKIFILVSTVLTWARTKPQNPDDTDAVLTEEEFRRRRPHPSFRQHHNLEKLVLKLTKGQKTKLNGYVVGSGIQYGRGENLFHYFFKVSWLMQFPKVPVFGEGTNHIPTIHVYDLGGVIQNIIDLKPKSKYILAIDSSMNTFGDIVQRISNLLGPQQIQTLPEQEAIAMEAFKTEELEYLKINLRLDAFIIKDSFKLDWVSEAGMVENMESIVEEYRDTRQLLSVKICLVGPPAVGKSSVAEKLCHFYQIPHIRVQGLIEGKMKELRERSTETDPDLVSEEEAAAAQKQLRTIEKRMNENEGQLADLICEILLEKLNSKQCINQGFVLDGFPETQEEAKRIFSGEFQPCHNFMEENQDLDSGLKTPVYNKKITPEYVFELQAKDDFLIKRVQELPECVAEQMHYTQDEFVSRLKRYRQLSGAEDTLLDYFDELEIHPEHIEVTVDNPANADVMKNITETVGPPKNYGLSPEEQEEEDRRKEKEAREKLAAQACERKHRKEAALAEMTTQYEEWKKNVSEVKRQEDELLEARALPLRSYLMKHVMPSLAAAMTDCSKIKPEDPVDFLAEHLLRNIHQEEDKQF